MSCNKLRSHKTLESLGFARYEKRSGNGYWIITKRGQSFLQDNQSLIEYLLANDFDYLDTREAFSKVEIEHRDRIHVKRRIIVFDERIVITEGEKAVVERQIYTRSRKLREAAIEHYSRDGKIVCAACSFDFEAVYGELGGGFIEIHHMKPVLAYETDDLEKVIQEALANVIPLW